MVYEIILVPGFLFSHPWQDRSTTLGDDWPIDPEPEQLSLEEHREERIRRAILTVSSTMAWRVRLTEDAQIQAEALEVELVTQDPPTVHEVQLSAEEPATEDAAHCCVVTENVCSKSESKDKANLTQPEDSRRTLLALLNKKLWVKSLKKYWRLVKELVPEKITTRSILYHPPLLM